MTPEKWEKIGEIFEAAAELPPSRRDDFVEKQCGGDDELLYEVRSLLAAETHAGDFIEEPIVPAYGEKDDEPWSYIGGEIGHYRIERSIGSGGMGDVYLAVDTRLNRRVAIKTLPSALARDPSFVRRFRYEAQAAANLNHPNLATVYSVEEIDGRSMITMEYVEGQLLTDVVPPGGFDLRRFLDLFVPISDAFCHAHERGVVHRDIKPGNIMITPDGVPKILDFGLAQMAAEQADASNVGITHPGQIIGTPAYMSPEQAEGKPVDERSDIFSFGVVMFEALTGERPFKGEKHAEVVRNVVTADPPKLRKLRPELPTALVKMVEKCMAKSPAARVQKMADINAFLSELWTTMSRSTSLRDSSLRRLYREFSPASPRWILPAVLLIIAAAFGARYMVEQMKPDQPVSFADLTFRKLSQANNIVYAHITPDGRSIVYNSIDEEERRSMSIRLVDDRNALELLPPQRVQFWGGITISGDSSQIYFITAEWTARFGTLYRVSTLGGQPRRLLGNVNDLGSLSANGERLLIVRYGDPVNIISVKADDGSDERVLHSVGPNCIARDPHFSADEKLIYFAKVENVGRNERWSLVSIPTSGGAETTIIPPQKQRINEIAVLRDGRGLLVNQEDQFSNLNQLYYVDPAAGTHTRITNDLNSYFGLSVSADGNSIVTAERRRVNNVLVGDPAEPLSFRRVTREPIAYSSVQWAPNGRLIYDASDNNVPHIWSSNYDGTDAQQLTPPNSSDHEPKVSPDGRSVVFTSDRTGEQKIWRMNIDGSSPFLLTPFDGRMTDPRFTPDGRSVIFKWSRADDEVLGRVPADGGEPSEMPMYGDTYWALSPDGTRVAYAIRDEFRQPSRVAVRRLNEAEPYLTLEISPTGIFDWARDRDALIYKDRLVQPDPFSSLWSVDLATQTRQLVYTSKPEFLYEATFSHDGRRLAVVQGRLITDAVMITKIKPQ